jgi:hypothetical protein
MSEEKAHVRKLKKMISLPALRTPQIVQRGLHVPIVPSNNSQLLSLETL